MSLNRFLWSPRVPVPCVSCAKSTCQGRRFSDILLAPRVCAIFNISLREVTVPLLRKCTDIRRLSNVQPPKLIHKDLRPISLIRYCLSAWSNALRMAIAGDQVEPQQFGSVKGTSTLRAVIELVPIGNMRSILQIPWYAHNS